MSERHGGVGRELCASPAAPAPAASASAGVDSASVASEPESAGSSTTGCNAWFVRNSGGGVTAGGGVFSSLT